MSLLLLFGGILASMGGILMPAKHFIDAAFDDRQLLGAFLAVLLPVATAFTAPGQPQSRRRLAWVALAVTACALVLTGNRSGYLGALAGLFIVLVFTRGSGAFQALRPSKLTPRKPYRIALLLTAILAVVTAFLALSGAGPTLRERLTIESLNTSLRSRLETWDICVQMLRDRPLAGWGVGSFPMKAANYSAYIPSAAQPPIA